jgi:hypothetical protein
MGLEAAQRVLHAIRSVPGKAEIARLHQTNPELVVRMSTAPPPVMTSTVKSSRRTRT